MDNTRDVRHEARFSVDDWVMEVVHCMTQESYEDWFIRKVEESKYLEDTYGTERYILSD